ncbi:MAG TPA: hypothetical protein VMA35_10150 [Candidatus Sulfopaludibacter sp.]|nr:hypothetical protein [Candidatus Sulfopaludibacter sp.]
MKNIPYVLAIQSMVGVLLCAKAFGQSYTTATVSGDAYAGNYSQSNPSNASGSTTGDFSSGFSVWNSSAQAGAAFGFNSAYAMASYAYAVGYGNPSYGENPTASASYSLNWNMVGGSQSGTIVSVQAGLGDSVNGLYTGVLSFIYGTPFNFQSLLELNASYPYASATAASIWDDTITFLGQPTGMTGTATFTVSLTGSDTTVPSQYVGPSAAGLVTFDKTGVVGDFSSGAVLSSVELPSGASLESASGTAYPVSNVVTPTFVPEPGMPCLLGLGLGGLWLCRFEPKRRVAFQTRYVKGRS